MRQVKNLPKFISRAPTEGPRVLVADIETLPIKGYVWSLFQKGMNPEWIEDPTRLMSFAGKWLHDDAYYYIDNRGQGDPRNDFLSSCAAHHILSHTDMVVAHNGKKFDMRKLRSFFAMHRLAPLAPVQVIDTLHLNATAFGFDSQRLAFVSKHFSQTEKDRHKNFPGSDLWLECMKDNPKAWRECQKYNVADIVANEEMYLELRGWYEAQPNFGIFYEPGEEGEHRCPVCGSEHVHITKRNRRTQVGVYHQYKCDDCGKYSRGRYIIRNKKERAHVLV